MTPETIKQTRHTMAMSQDNLAKAMGVDRRTVIRWEMGDVPITGPAAIALWFLSRYGPIYPPDLLDGS